MPEEPLETPATGGEEPVTPPGAENVFVRLTFWQTILSVVGVFIAIVALYAALKESAAVRQQTAAAVWPFVQFSVEDYDTGDTAGFSMVFTNAGVGPARMHGVRLVMDGQPIRDWAQAVSVVGGDTGAGVDRNFISHRVIRPDESVRIIGTADPGVARLFQRAMASPGNHVAYCYCSIFDACWLADSRKDLQRPQPVDACPDYGDDTFVN